MGKFFKLISALRPKGTLALILSVPKNKQLGGFGLIVTYATLKT
mgnify:CR=1 FL=1|jgi:hypothetical protein